MKVLWWNHNVEEATWEPEDQMQEQYPHLFYRQVRISRIKFSKGGDCNDPDQLNLVNSSVEKKINYNFRASVVVLNDHRVDFLFYLKFG